MSKVLIATQITAKEKTSDHTLHDQQKKLPCVNMLQLQKCSCHHPQRAKPSHSQHERAKSSAVQTSRHAVSSGGSFSYVLGGRQPRNPDFFHIKDLK